MQQLEARSRGIQIDGATYSVPLTFTSHTLVLQNRYGSLDLNRVKDWVLSYPESARRIGPIFSGSQAENDGRHPEQPHLFAEPHEFEQG